MRLRLADICEDGIPGKSTLRLLLVLSWITESDSFRHLAVVPGTDFGECSIRCYYATALDDIKEAMTRIKRFISKL